MSASFAIPVLLGRCVRLFSRHAVATLMVCAVATALAWNYTVDNIGINTDTGDMISPDLDWRQRYIDYKASFEALSSTLSIVVEAGSVDAAESGARRLASALTANADGFQWVYTPGLEPFFRRNGLLYLDLEELGELSDELTAAQPILGRLASEPTAPALLELMGDLVEAEERVDTETLERLFEELSAVLEATGTGVPRELAWRELMSAEAASKADRRRFVIAKPVLDYSELLPAGPAIETIRVTAKAVGLTAERGFTVRITGGTAMSHEELDTVSSGMAVAGGVALVLVLGVLLVGLGSWRAAVAALVTLIMGLIWTGAFAAAAVGHLNLISVAFAVLYIGLGVDYAVHFSARFAELLADGIAREAALVRTAEEVGASLALCAVTTGVGFFAFVPTDFAGVSELGIISGTGMFISLVASLVVLPAALSLLKPPAMRVASGRARPQGHHRRLVLGAVVLVAGGSALAASSVRFDHNPINLRDPDTESVATYLELLSEARVSPWRMQVLTAASDAQALERNLEALEAVHSTRSPSAFVPTEQDAKLAVIDELSLVLGLTLEGVEAASEADPGRTKAALETLGAQLDAVTDPLMRDTTRRLARAVKALSERFGDDAERARLAADLQRRAFAYLPDQIERLSMSLSATPVSFEALPRTITERWIAADGRWRVEVTPSEDVSDNDALARFVAAVHSVAPSATGTPEVNLGAGRVVVSAFAQALVSATLIIVVLLWLITRSAGDVVLVLAPLGLAALMTAAAMAMLDIPFNFANVIALPLLLGIGVDNGVHMVHRMRAAPPGPEGLLATSTSRAVVISALTTVCGFGNLAYSPHPGTASMGQVLTIGLALTLVATLLVLPALLESSRRSST